MKSKIFIYAGLGVATVAILFVGMKVFSKKSPVRKSPAAFVAPAVDREPTPAEATVPAPAKPTAVAENMSTAQPIPVPEPLASTVPSETPKEQAPVESNGVTIDALKQTIESKNIEVANLKASLAEKDRELASSREWSKTRTELIQQLRSELKGLQAKLDAVNTSIASRTEALDGVKVRTFNLNP